jgi:hypothetical protein
MKELIMKEFIVKILTLENSLYTVNDVEWSIVGNTAWSVAWNVAWNVAWHAVCDNSRNVARKTARSLATIAATVATTTDAKNGKEIVDVACLSMMNNYDKIFTAVNNLGDKIRPKENINPIDITRQLITFDNQVKKLLLMSKRFRLFYFFKVHEIIVSLPPSETGDINDDDDNRNTLLLDEFNQLLKRTGDLNEYNQLFVSDITLHELEKLDELNIPRDLVKLVVDYCHLSVHNKSDLNLILDRIILSNFS